MALLFVLMFFKCYVRVSKRKSKTKLIRESFVVTSLPNWELANKGNGFIWVQFIVFDLQRRKVVRNPAFVKKKK